LCLFQLNGNPKNDILFDILCYSVTDIRVNEILPPTSDSVKSIKYILDRYYYDWNTFEFKSHLDDFNDFFKISPVNEISSNNPEENQLTEVNVDPDSDTDSDFIEKKRDGFSVRAYMDFLLEYSFMYLPETDSGRDLDEIISVVMAELEEARIAEQLDMLENENSDFTEEDEEFFKLNKSEVNYAGKDSTLSAMEFDDEIFISQTDGDNLVKIASNTDETIREFYDSSYRLIRKENWKISTVEESKIKNLEEFTYKNQSNRPSKKVITTDDSKELFNYNLDGLCTSYKKYALVSVEETKKKSDESSSDGESTKNIKMNSYIVVKESWKYDSDKRIISTVKTSYTYDSDAYKKLTDTFEQKYVYTYNDEWEDISPDMEYYEDKILKQKVKYTKTPGTYVTQTYFDKDFAVKTYYKESKKVKEVFTANGEVWRVKEYEKE